MQIDLIGTNHGYQLVGFQHRDWAGFSQFLQGQIAQGGYDLLAEELNEEGVRRHSNVGATGSNLQALAGELSIAHLFADPTLAESPDRSAEAREPIWLARIAERGAERVLLIIGANHIGSFSARLEQAGHSVRIIERDWEEPNYVDPVDRWLAT